MTNNRLKIVESVDIVKEVSKYIDVEAKGRNYVSICPFHQDSNPSLTISPEKKIFKCFVCGEGGDVVSFVSKFNNISSGASIKKIANENNITITNSNQISKKINSSDYLFEDINQFYISSLFLTPQGKEALKYLQGRGIDIETIKEFKLGYSYDVPTSLYEYLIKKSQKEMKYSEFEIKSINQFNSKVDLFLKRITIPIIQKEQIVGFGGRIIKNNEVKYVNSKDSKFFKKSEVLFNLENALELSPDKSLVLVEGYFDVINAHQNKLHNTVALMGTAFTDMIVNKVKRKINKIFLSLDSDDAGIRSALNIGKILKKNKIDVYVIELGKYKDLDEFFQENTIEEYYDMQKNAKHFKIFQMFEEIKKINVSNLNEKEKYLKLICSDLNNEDIIVQNEVLTYLESNVNLPQEMIKAYMKPLKKMVHKSNTKIKANPIINIEDFVIMKMSESKKDFLDLKDKIEKENIRLVKVNYILECLNEYYMIHDDFDYVYFINQYNDIDEEIRVILKRSKVEKKMTNDEIILGLKRKRFNILHMSKR